MGEVAGGVAIVEGQAAAAAQAADAAPAAMSFVDAADGIDAADAILDEVLAGGGSTAEGGEAPAADGDAEPAKVEAKPADAKPAEPAKAPEDAEAVKLRRGFAKLAEERQRVVELQNAARAARTSAEQFATKAQKHDEIVSALAADPAGFLLTHGGEELVQKALQGFIEMEKSPAEREMAKFRKEQTQRDQAAAQREQEQTAATWRNDVIAKVQADERFDLVNSLGLHADVIGIMTGYYERYSERDDKGNVVKPAILSWDAAAQAAEDHRAAMLDKSKRYGKRTPAAADPATDPKKKDAPTAKPAAAPAKKAPTSLSSVPVADSPHREDELSLDPDERQAQILAEMGL